MMNTKVTNQVIQQIVSGTVNNLISSYLVERRSRGLSENTIIYYSKELLYFNSYLDEIGVANLDELNSNEIRQSLIGL